MPLTVWKFSLNHKTIQNVSMPVDAQILDVFGYDQQDVIEMWALVDPEDVTESRTFVIAGTGHELPDMPLDHIGTAQQGKYVWHVFEKGDS